MKTDYDNWRFTSQNEPRGYIRPQRLDELWFHTGTNCNLCCPLCLEGSQPGNSRIENLTLKDALVFMQEGMDMGVKKFSFTGGEPFTNPHFMGILEEALERRPCLVLSNGTEPLVNCLPAIKKLLEKPHPLTFRISLDAPDQKQHDSSRGQGNFRKALKTLGILHQMGFGVSIARLMHQEEDTQDVDNAYVPFLAAIGITEDIPIIRFPNFHPPGAHPQVPEITETCMTKYLNADQRESFMCNFSKMVIKVDGRCGVYACTLVDDSSEYNLGSTLKEAMKEAVMLGHHRCFACFSCGASCSES